MILSGRLVACRQTPIRSFKLLLLSIRIEVEHLHFARGPRTQAFQNLNRGCLPGAIRPEQTEDFAGAHFEIDSFYRLECAVRLSQPTNVNDKFRVIHRNVARGLNTILFPFVATEEIKEKRNHSYAWRSTRRKVRRGAHKG